MMALTVDWFYQIPLLFQVGSKSVLEFLTKCIKLLEKENQAGSSSRRHELIIELKKRRHLLAMKIAPRDSRSPVPPQRTSSTPSTPRCSSALAFASPNVTNNGDIFSNVSFTLFKSYKKTFQSFIKKYSLNFIET